MQGMPRNWSFEGCMSQGQYFTREKGENYQTSRLKYDSWRAPPKLAIARSEPALSSVVPVSPFAAKDNLLASVKQPKLHPSMQLVQIDSTSGGLKLPHDSYKYDSERDSALTFDGEECLQSVSLQLCQPRPIRLSGKL
jgi:hypothetical protein